MACDLVRFMPQSPTCATHLGFAKVVSLSSCKAVEGAMNKNRSYVESGKYRLILDPHQDVRKDFMHHRNSGFNHIVAKLAAEKGVAFGFSLVYMQTPQQLGRVLQALQLCRKYGVTIVLCTGALDASGLCAAHDLASFGKLLGLHPSEVRRALEVAQSL